MSFVIGVLWGKGNEKPTLPPGYHYIEEPKCWLLAEAPSGRRYYVSDKALFRQGVRVYPTMEFRYVLDDREIVSLPQLQLYDAERKISY